MPLLGSEEAATGSIPTAAGADTPGVAPSAGILSAIYTAGLVAPLADNYFPMASGNLRFPGDVSSNSYPNAAYFESASTPGDARIGAWLTRRYYNTGVGIGTVNGDEFVGYDPLWNKALSGINSFTFQTERVGFTSSSDETTQPGGLDYVELGDAGYAVGTGFFCGPATYPTPGFNNGGRVNYRLSLYNDLDGFVATRHEFNGWGQHVGFVEPKSTGITAAYYTAANFGNTPAADNNGIGWFIAPAQGDPPRVIYEGHMLSGASPGGAWGIGLWAASAAGNNLQQICSMDWTNGIQFFAPLTSLGGGSQVQLILSADIDVQTPGVYQWTPSIPGYYLAVNRTVFFLTQRTGVATSGFTCNWGNNVTHDNYGASATPGIASVNAAALPAEGAGPSFNTSNQPLIDAATPISVQITSGVTGTTVCKGRFGLWCTLIPVGALV